MEEKITNAEKKKLMKKYIDMYIVAIRSLAKKGENVSDVMFNDSMKRDEESVRRLLGDNIKLRDERKIVVSTNCVLLSMDSELSKIICRDYLFPIDKKWWVGFYSRAGYYRSKNLAVDRFIDLMKNE